MGMWEKIRKVGRDMHTAFWAEIKTNLLVLGWQGSGKSTFLYIGGGTKEPSDTTQKSKLSNGICYIKSEGACPSCKAMVRYDLGGESSDQKRALVYEIFKDVDTVLYFFNTKDLMNQVKIRGFAPADYTLGATRQFIQHFQDEFSPSSSDDPQKQQKLMERPPHKKLKNFIFVGTHTDELPQWNKNQLKEALGFEQLKGELKKKLGDVNVYLAAGSQCDDGKPKIYRFDVWYDVILCLSR